jgi:hypothetical protein
MDLFWNAGEGKTIGGVDLLGLRQVDQDLEAVWVAGVTTISIRARYLSLLAWVFAEHYERQLASDGGSSVFDWDAFKAIVGRLEFITLAATALRPEPDTSGALGKRNLSPQLDALKRGESVALDMEGLALHGTYYGPCRALGLLQDGASAQRPIRIPQAGQELSRARSAAGRGARLVDRVFTGGSLHRDDLTAEGHLFDLDGLVIDASAGERAALVGAFRRSPDFRATMTWIFRSVAGAPRSPWELVKQNYDACTAAAPPSGRIELAFAELELRRRVHFALEVLLAAVKRTLSALEVADLPEIVRQWEKTDLGQPDSALAPIVGAATWSFADPLARFVADAGPGSFEKAWIAPRDCWEATPGQQALYALALLVACERQSRGLRTACRIPDRRGAMEQVFTCLQEGAGRPLPEVLEGLLHEQVVGRHLEVTLGKMGRGLGCSLRFYPEGSSLRPLGADVYGGLSALRLPNVFTMLADLGLLLRDDDWRYALTDTGKQLAAELDA